MLEAICKMLYGLSRPDNGVESVLNQPALEGLIELIRGVYGDHAADTVNGLFYVATHARGNGYRAYDEVEDALRICLQGRGR
jgi:hypothetical protein